MLHSANNDLVNRLIQTKRLLIDMFLELCANLEKDVKGSVESNIGRLKKHPYLVSARVNGVIGVVAKKGILLTKRKPISLFVYYSP